MNQSYLRMMKKGGISFILTVCRANTQNNKNKNVKLDISFKKMYHYHFSFTIITFSITVILSRANTQNDMFIKLYENLFRITIFIGYSITYGNYLAYLWHMHILHYKVWMYLSTDLLFFYVSGSGFCQGWVKSSTLFVLWPWRQSRPPPPRLLPSHLLRPERLPRERVPPTRTVMAPTKRKAPFSTLSPGEPRVSLSQASATPLTPLR